MLEIFVEHLARNRQEFTICCFLIYGCLLLQGFFNIFFFFLSILKVLPNSPPEDNLDPIEEEHPLQQPQSVVICKKEGILPHTTTSTNQNQDEGVLGVSEINNAIHPTLTADSAIASESTESGSNTSNNNAGPQHRWSNNRRSQILKQQSIHQGEFNKVVFSDSRRRPLSCTPPSTSLSTSVSIDDEDLTASMASSNPQSANGCGDAVHVAGLVVNQLQHSESKSQKKIAFSVEIFFSS